MPHPTTISQQPENAQKTYYDLLNLPPPPHTPALTPQLLKKRYHRALLRWHPDKQPQFHSQTPTTHTPTVDLLSLAYTTLLTPQKRAGYDASLLNPGLGPGLPDSSVIQLADLEEFVEHESDGKAKWTKACRCGEEEGYVVREQELEEAEMDGMEEVLVGCAGCSLWLRIGFGIVNDDDDV